MIPVLPGYKFIEALHEGVNTVIYRALKQLDQTLAIVKALKVERYWLRYDRGNTRSLIRPLLYDKTRR